MIGVVATPDRRGAAFRVRLLPRISLTHDVSRPNRAVSCGSLKRETANKRATPAGVARCFGASRLWYRKIPLLLIFGRTHAQHWTPNATPLRWCRLRNKIGNLRNAPTLGFEYFTTQNQINRAVEIRRHPNVLSTCELDVGCLRNPDTCLHACA
jgi:hypothetical protein